MQRIDLEKDTLSLDGITSDSRSVKKGYLFAALPGSKADGSQFIEDAIQHGARYILVSEDYDFSAHEDKDIGLIVSQNVRQDFARLAAQFYKLQPNHIVAVTGTSGKTSTVSFVQQLWHLAGYENCASLGTLGIRGPKMRKSGHLTTPDAQTLHANLADLKAVGIDHLAMEASSHGLDQHRLDGVSIEAAAFTNLSRDHLDYHQTMEDYFQAKSRLFSEVMPEGSRAVLNADDEYFSQLNDICKKRNHKIISYGRQGRDITLIDKQTKPKGQIVKFSIQEREYEILLPLVGEFQVMNALCALALTLPYVDKEAEHIKRLENLRGVPGRLELIDGHPKGAVYVDYAHKPAALEIILETLRHHTSKRLICVFGCGGNRDRGKRVIMGEISKKLADKVYVTDDNPRYENAAEIRKKILEGNEGAIEIADRHEAIQTAIQDVEEGDILVIAGKGHEEGQIIEDKVLPFSDAEVVRNIIEGLKK
ncbi:MAG: UDP-N-acetylmuramoyl-L-alanyl-D-glutamate--2,6-diaminopimelate ligase [Pseudomonadota bacterium]